MSDIQNPMDEPNAKLTMKLVTKTGFRAETNFPAISARQWAAINALCERPELAKLVFDDATGAA